MSGPDDYYEDNIVKDRVNTHRYGHDARNTNYCSIKEAILHLMSRRTTSSWIRNNPILQSCHRMLQCYCVISNNINLSNDLMTYTMWTIDQGTNTNMITMEWKRMNFCHGHFIRPEGDEWNEMRTKFFEENLIQPGD